MINHPDAHHTLRSYSQHGEDLFIWNIFHSLNMKIFSYIDLGAHHPNIISNTKLFYDRGCRGINIEPNPILFGAFAENRPHDINVNCGVSTEEGELSFYIYDDISPCNTFSYDESLRLRDCDKRFGENREIMLPVKSLDQLIQEYAKGKYPDFINCDIEGFDFAVLAHADFEDSSPLVICVEVRYEEVHRMTQMLEKKGFFPYARIMSNVIYINKSEKNLFRAGLGKY